MPGMTVMHMVDTGRVQLHWSCHEEEEGKDKIPVINPPAIALVKQVQVVL
jgi:hypothetical protein